MAEAHVVALCRREAPAGPARSWWACTCGWVGSQFGAEDARPRRASTCKAAATRHVHTATKREAARARAVGAASRHESVQMTATVGSGRELRSGDIWLREPSVMPVPMRELHGAEGIVMGLRIEMLTLEDDAGYGGAVSCGAGLGNDAIILTWGARDAQRQAVVRGSELLRAWVKTFSDEDAAAFPEGIR